jgi:hypothetical protein
MTLDAGTNYGKANAVTLIPMIKEQLAAASA